MRVTELHLILGFKLTLGDRELVALLPSYIVGSYVKGFTMGFLLSFLFLISWQNFLSIPKSGSPQLWRLRQQRL